MIPRIRKYVDDLFQDAPHTKKAYDLKEEVCSNLIDKYTDLTAGGMSEADAYSTVIAGIGDVGDLFADLEGGRAAISVQEARYQKRRAILISSAVALYILSVVPAILSEAIGFDEIYGAIGLFVLCAIATFLLVYNALTKPRYQAMDDTMVEEFKEWKAQRSHPNHTVRNSILGAYWILVVAVYFLLSFFTMHWEVTWIVFLIGMAIDQIIRAVFSLKGDHHE